MEELKYRCPARRVQIYTPLSGCLENIMQEEDGWN